MIQIRPYTSADIESIAGLMNDLGYPTSVEEMKQRMALIEAESSYHTFVATINGIVAGMVGIRQVLYYEDDGCATQITVLVTKKEYEGHGIGTALIGYVEQWAEERNSNTLYLTSGIKEERIRAHELYKKQGFVVTGYRFVKRITR